MVLLKVNISENTVSRWVKFTFHYSSIKRSFSIDGLDAGSYLHSTMVLLKEYEIEDVVNDMLFTFHYGSIKSFHGRQLLFLLCHLHSTMVLLKANKLLHQIHHCKNLHSTMVLLKDL